MKIDGYHPTKKKIFLTASKLFSQKGYANVGVREIAIEVGIKGPTLYSHYPSKEAILDDLFQFYTSRLTQFYKEAENIDFDQDPIVCFKQMVFTFEEDERELMRQLLLIVFNEQYRSPRAAKIIYDIILRGIKKSGFDFLSHLQEKGRIQCEDIDSLAEVFPRIGLTFAMQYAKDDIHRQTEYETVLMAVFKLILNSSTSENKQR